MIYPKNAEIDGWKLQLWEPIAGSTIWRAEAKDALWHRYAEAFGLTPTEALEALSRRTDLDLAELLATFGL